MKYETAGDPMTGLLWTRKTRDKIADELSKKKIKEHVIHGMWTPSGFFHIGNARPELLNPSFINKSLLNRKLKSKQNFIIDDFDDFDKIPKGIDVNKEEFEKHLGKPLRDVPSPDGNESWAHYFQKDVLLLVIILFF